MTSHEKIAASNIKDCFNFEMGGLYNAYLDGETDFPTLEEAKEMIYFLSINDKYIGGNCFVGGAPKEMRFAGKKFCMNYIDKLFANDPDMSEIPWKEQ